MPYNRSHVVLKITTCEVLRVEINGKKTFKGNQRISRNIQICKFKIKNIKFFLANVRNDYIFLLQGLSCIDIFWLWSQAK